MSQTDTFDPFSSNSDPFKAFESDPFAASNNNDNQNNVKIDPWSNFGNTFDDEFSADAAANVFKIEKKESTFGDDENSAWNLTTTTTNINQSFNHIAESHNSNNWALFEDG
jgi:hypothetical protein